MAPGGERRKRGIEVGKAELVEVKTVMKDIVAKGIESHSQGIQGDSAETYTLGKGIITLGLLFVPLSRAGS